MRISVRLFAAATLAAAAALPVAGHAQSNPSADQIIKSLRPSGAVSGSTRGIRPVGPSVDAPAAAPSAPPAGASVATSAPVTHAAPAKPVASAEPAAAPSVNLTVQFANGSAALTPAATHTLDELGRALSSASLATYKFRIEGHTDTVGSAELNKSLSEQRAEAVVSYLASKFNIDKARLTPVGMGEDGLLVPTPANTPEPRNRRVQVVNLGA